MSAVPIRRDISWIRHAQRDFDDFPPPVREDVTIALALAAEGKKAQDAKHFKGVGAGVFELALRHRGNAYRVIYDVQSGDAIWVIHAFKKKSKSGIKTPQLEIDLIRTRLRQLKEMLK
jgi:phage-related protein